MKIQNLIITINEEACARLTSELRQELIVVCPDRILELDEVSGKLTVSEYTWEIETYTVDLKVAHDTMKEKPEDDDLVTLCGWNWGYGC